MFKNAYQIARTVLIIQAITSQVVIAQDQTSPIEFDKIDVISKSADGYIVSNTSSATNTDTPIKQIPQSVYVVPRQLIDDQQNVTVSEALSNVSNVIPNAEFSSPANDATVIRGFAAEQLIDGFTQYYNPGDRESLINIDSLEVLKGSNAVLFSGGAGSPVGGVVNINSKLPQAEQFGEVGIKVGSHDFSQTFFDLNQPATDNVLFRITGEYTNTESNIDVIEQDRYNLNPSLTFTNNDDTSLTLQAKHSRWNQQEYQGLPATGTVTGNFKIDPELFIGNEDIPDSKSEFDALWATFDHKINEHWSFNLKARYAESEFSELTQNIIGSDSFQANMPYTAPSTWQLANVALHQKQREKSILGSTLFKFNVGETKNKLLLGADYTELQDKGSMTADYITRPNFVDLSAPTFNTPYIEPPKSAFTTVNDSELKNTVYGAYAQLQSSIYDRLHLLAGLRRGTVKISYDEFAPLSPNQQETKETKWLPRVGAVFDINDIFSVFASYGEGMRAAPYTTFSANVSPTPPRSKASEGGLKFDFNSELAGQFAFYEIKRTNVGVGSPTTPTGEQVSRGFDTDITWNLNTAWTLLANYGYTKAKFTNDVSTTVVSGNKIAGVPKKSARLWAKYQFQSDKLRGLNVGIGAKWQSKVYVDDANNFTVDGYHTIDAAINYETNRYRLGLSIKNLTNQDYYQFYEYFSGRVRPDDGTTAYLSAAIKY